MDANKFEIQWREILLKKLKSPLASLEKQCGKEWAKRNERIRNLRAYPTLEDAQEAYGYGDITLEEYDLICRGFEEEEKTMPFEAARDELAEIVAKLKKDIRDLEWESLPEEEKDRIIESNGKFIEERRAALQAQRLLMGDFDA
jgi:hypothetical protein